MRTRRHLKAHTIAPGVLGGLAVLMVAMTPSLAGAVGDSSSGSAALRVEKTVEGEGSGPFKFEAICLWGSTSLVDEEFEIEAGESKVFEGLPAGTECHVEETDGGGASSTEVTPVDGEVTIPDYDEAVVTFLNVFDPVTTTSAPTTTTTAASATTTTTKTPTTTTTGPSLTTTTVPTVLGAVLVAPAPAAELPRTGNDGALSLGMAGLGLGGFGLVLVSLTNVIRARRTASAARR